MIVSAPEMDKEYLREISTLGGENSLSCCLDHFREAHLCVLSILSGILSALHYAEVCC